MCEGTNRTAGNLNRQHDVPRGKVLGGCWYVNDSQVGWIYAKVNGPHSAQSMPSYINPALLRVSRS